MITRQCRRTCLKLFVMTLGVSVLLSATIAGAADEYPTKPIIINVGYPPGGAGGNSAQVFADIAKKYLTRQQAIVVNFKPGAGTALAADYVLKQPPDGYNLYWISVDLPVKLAEEGSKLPFSLDDFSFIGTIGDVPIVVPVRAESRFRDFKEFSDHARKNPGDMSYGSPGVGTHGYLTGQILGHKCGVKLNHVPFAGSGQFVTALLGGHIDTIVPSLASISGYVKPGGGMRVLATLTSKRLAELPNVPTAQEMGCEVVRTSWFGLAAPKGIPQPALKILRDTFSKAMADSQMVASVSKLGFIPPSRESEDMKKLAQEELNADREIFKGLGR